MLTKLNNSVHEFGGSNKAHCYKILKQLPVHQPVKQRDILATFYKFRVQVYKITRQAHPY